MLSALGCDQHGLPDDLPDIHIRPHFGVHSGNLFAGVIGEAKLQFDIWGKKANPLHETPLVTQISQILLGLDVTIANVLESTGVAGFVHISEATLNNLSKQRYVIEDGPEKARNHPLLSKHRINTYIIREDLQKDAEESDENFGELHAVSLFNVGSRSRLSDNTNESLKELFYEELREEFRKMPVSAFK